LNQRLLKIAAVRLFRVLCDYRLQYNPVYEAASISNTGMGAMPNETLHGIRTAPRSRRAAWLANRCAAALERIIVWKICRVVTLRA